MFGEEENKSGLNIDESFVSDSDYNISRSGCKWKVIEWENKNIHSVFVACGYSHHCILTNKGYPYSWGNNVNGRCGIQLKDKYKKEALNQEDTDSNDENDQAGIIDLDSNYIGQPLIIQNLKNVFRENIRIVKENEKNEEKNKNDDGNEDGKNQKADNDSDENIKKKNQEFSCQEKLQESKTVLNEDTLKLKDLSLKAKLNSLVARINENVRSLTIHTNHQLFQTETTIISGIFNFPKKIEHNDSILSIVPKIILNNKSIYEDIFSLLYMHPCHIKKIIEIYPLLKVSKPIIQFNTLSR